MFKKTLLAATVAALMPVVGQAEITYDPIGYVPDPWKDVPELEWKKDTSRANSVSKVYQDGWGNDATVKQEAFDGRNDKQAMSLVMQLGKRNTADVTEDATSVRSAVYQEGRGNVATVDLEGARYGTTDSIVEQFGSESLWIELMLRDEHGVSTVDPDPWRAALTTFVAFVLAGSVPLLPFAVLGAGRFDIALAVALIATGFTFLAIGALKARISGVAALRSAVSTLLVGASAASIAWLVALLVQRLAG